MFPLLAIQLMTLFVTTASGSQLIGLEGGDIILNVTGYEDQSPLTWLKWFLNKTRVIHYYGKEYTNDGYTDYVLIVNPDYEGLVDFDKKTFSLHLKNLQRKHSGVYSAKKDVLSRNIMPVASYNLTVMKRAAPPNLTVVSAWFSNDFCNVTLQCVGGADMSLNSTCSSTTSTNSTFECSEEEDGGGGGGGGSWSLSISVNGTIASCNHSNPVSWRLASIDVASVCGRGVRLASADVGNCLVRAVAISVGLFVMVMAIAAVTIRLKLIKNT
ncbi:SLAM family member 9-like [Engraulis encrasicolus]|uniref:SLAM family member 9-like n=1 Tax=Engraulis encrasicolus TaxID=184585 RepID=UPI002FD0869F